MHKLRQMIKEVNKTHSNLGPLIAINILAAKAKKTILNVAPAGCGKSVACDTVALNMQGRSKQFTSITLAGMVKLKEEFTDFDGHVVIDDLGAEKSMWSRVSTITALANLVYTHYVRKVTHTSEIGITNFNGSVSLNIQPVLLNSLVQSDEWVSVVRDKVMRYYHLFRPVKPRAYSPQIDIKQGPAIHEVELTARGGKLWYQLISIGLTQWSQARVLEHIPDLLRASAALDGRKKVSRSDYYLLIKLLKPIQMERYIIKSFGLEQGRVFNNNLYCLLVELATWGEPTILTICEDYKVSPSTVNRVISQNTDWCWIKKDKPKKLMPTDQTKEIFDTCAVNQKW